MAARGDEHRVAGTDPLRLGDGLCVGPLHLVPRKHCSGSGASSPRDEATPGEALARCGGTGRRTILSGRKTFTTEEALSVGRKLGIDWGTSAFGVEQLRAGMDVELEHGLRDPETNVTDDDPWLTARIAYAHLKELPDYYTRLEHMERESRLTPREAGRPL